jgi:hypothetical protein
MSELEHISSILSRVMEELKKDFDRNEEENEEGYSTVAGLV